MHIVSAVLMALGIIGTAQAPLPAQAAQATGPANYCSVDIREPDIITCATDPNADAPMSELPAGNSSATASLLIARLYDNANYDTSAGYLNVYAGADCTVSTGNIDAQLSDLGVWNDRVSSFTSFGSCAARLWSGTGFQGSAYPNTAGFLVSSSSIPSMNDRTRSVQFS